MHYDTRYTERRAHYHSQQGPWNSQMVNDEMLRVVGIKMKQSFKGCCHGNISGANEYAD
ncbi:protein of unknown function [Vibrio tapetis subsp. tapetis]|uniref:Uncharacterized protein n=1 Tax=Vibrio tapetis subsp. tapetis TaxID=1671868 RepID=A0A2N8ZJL7_9VIBR|nr:protein of unknown function [Vibrio tapetis subsp. tapetis]